MWRGADSADRRVESRPYFDRAGADRLLILGSNCFKNTCLGWAGPHVRLAGVVNRGPISTERVRTGLNGGPFADRGAARCGAGLILVTGVWNRGPISTERVRTGCSS